MKTYKDNSVAAVVRNSKAFNDPKLNPHLQGKPLHEVFTEEAPRAAGYPNNTLRSHHPGVVEGFHAEAVAPTGKRVRQGEPALGKWEAEWLELVKRRSYTNVKAQSLRLRLGNGAWYKPDVTGVQTSTGRLHCFEVKGGSKMKGVAKGVLAIKVAADRYPEFVFVLCWKEGGQWRQQQVEGEPRGGKDSSK